MGDRLFTIIIPTYNRCELLKSSLERIAPVASKYLGKVSIYVSDNCSTDSTSEVVNEYKEKYECIEYYRQKENIGAANNFKDAIQRVNSKYVALISDDDIVLPYYIPTILELLRNNQDVGLINVNMISCNYSYTKFTGIRDFHAFEGDLFYYQYGGEFIKSHLEIPSLISSNVFDRRAFVKEIKLERVMDYPGYEWLALLYYAVIDKPCIYYDLPLLVQLNPKNQRWEHNIPWYYVCGFGKLFENLDKEYNGIQEKWNQRFSGWTQYWLFELINRYKLEYKERYNQMSCYLTTKRERFLLIIAVYGNRFLLRLADKLFRVINLI